jgi:hypothetical protein
VVLVSVALRLCADIDGGWWVGAVLVAAGTDRDIADQLHLLVIAVAGLFPKPDRAGAGVCGDRRVADRLGLLVGAAALLAGAVDLGVWLNVVGDGGAGGPRTMGDVRLTENWAY